MSAKGYVATSDNGISLLFLNKDDAMHSTLGNSIELRSIQGSEIGLKLKSWPGGYLRVYGIYHATLQNVGSVWRVSGYISDIHAIGNHDIDSAWDVRSGEAANRDAEQKGAPVP